ncbi:TetR/AcrR family transcriptional regulator [Candidatus Nanosalina sp. VS9-1]|uniref:TetR/AcrR family transcriptional regulator n=1 Tax=Candidatus Nanosalina sp. VS9-1 TaxID=3388566 RepID=UPI0039DF3108
MAEDSKQKIMDATYCALCEHGYADLSIQKIADEFDKGKSLIYYHYDDKEDLMLSFLDYMQNHMESTHEEIMDLSPEERLDAFLDKALGLEEKERWEFQKAFLELRAQAAHNEKFKEKFGQMDRQILENLEEILSGIGIENRDISEIVLSSVEGAASRKVSIGDREGLQEMKGTIKDTVENLSN